MLYDVVLDRKVISNTLGAKCGFDNVLGVLDLSWEWVEVILSVQVKVDTMISKSLHVCLATRCGIALTVRRAHVCRIFPNDVSQRTFVLAHLVLSHS